MTKKSKILLQKIYGSEDIIDVEEDISYALLDESLPKDLYNFHKGDFKVTLEFIPHE